MEHKASITFPIGILHVYGDDHSVTRITWASYDLPDNNNLPVHMQECINTLIQYRDGSIEPSNDYRMPINVGTPFQRAVWNAAIQIRPGTVQTYGDVAEQIGRPRAARAVGNALNKNPFAILVPCHRVVGSNGPGGFAWGSSHKHWLLEHEY